MSEKHYRIVRLDVDNVKRLRAVSITPDGNVVVIGGRNGQGKSSLLDAIQYALSGGKSIPPDPIRHGAAKARVEVDLGDYVIERTITNRNAALVVRDAQGNKLSSPQGILDAICTKIAFDPGSFLRMSAKEQDQVLRKAAGLDFDELDRDRKQIYERRTELNRAVAQAQALFDAMVEHPDAPAEEVKFAEVYAELEQRRAKVAGVAELVRGAEKADAHVVEIDNAIAATRQAIADLEATLALKRASLEELNEQSRAALTACTTAYRLRNEAQTACPDPAEIEQQLAELEETNRKVRANAARAQAATDLANAKARVQDCTDAISGIDARKQRLLEDAKFPVTGLAFTELGPTLDGVPLDQASQAQLIRLSVAVGVAQNPQLRVLLVRDGSLLDSDSLRLLAQLAEEQEVQLWVERVSEDGAGCSVVIEDGEVADAEAAAE